MKKNFIQPSTLRTKVLLLTCVFASLILSSCSVMLPVSATSNPVGGSKTGTATATNILGLFWVAPDASIETAAANGGIKKVSTVNIKESHFLWIINTYQTTVKGD
jgi:hypothetical protein